MDSGHTVHNQFRALRYLKYIELPGMNALGFGAKIQIINMEMNVTFFLLLNSNSSHFLAFEANHFGLQ